MTLRSIAAVLASSCVCLAQTGTPPAKEKAANKPAAAAPAREEKLAFVRMTTTAGDILLELDREHAPVSVDHCLAYARRGAYDGTIFHRVMPAFVIQGGGFDKDLNERAKADEKAGHPDKPIKNEWTNGLKNTRGTIAMAREADPDTATREFYINVADNAKLDTPREQTGKAGYAVFGRVIAGMDVVDAIRQGKTRELPERDMKDVPVEPVVITRVVAITKDEAERPAKALPKEQPEPPADAPKADPTKNK
jgi:peptidyl-prolyl cis-trans isomerase A (cyclophilin A)